MRKNPQIPLHEILFGSSDRKESRRIKMLEGEGAIRKIAPRIYTSNSDDDAATVIRRNWLQILSKQYPGALLSYRSALEFRPTHEGHIFLTYTYQRNVTLPGLTIHLMKGHAPLKSDHPFFGDLYAAQEARAYLENLQETRSSAAFSKTFTRQELEEKLEMILKVRNESSLNELRHNARKVARQLHMQKEFAKLDKIIGALLATHESAILTSDVALRRALGEPVDANRVRLFEVLYNALSSMEFPSYPDKNTTPRSYRNFGFFESYFSNYIEGTKFGVEEAKQIVTTDTPLPARDEDSHDVLGTYKIVSSKKEMSICPADADHLLNILQYRHKLLLSARLSKKPGRFKDKNNFAGDTAFVDFALVKSTLKRGFDYCIPLRHPFARAAYIMFMISEVHPFLDGNGRIARVMMNAELTAGGLSKIIIPTVFREDYLLALRKFTRQHDPRAYIRMLQRAWAFSSNIYDTDINDMETYLRACDAFAEPQDGKLRLLMREDS